MSHGIEAQEFLILKRRSAPDNLEAQVQALKEFQQQPGFIPRKPVPKKKDSRLLTAFKEKAVNAVRFLFRRRRQPLSR